MFLAIFDMSRRTATRARSFSEHAVSSTSSAVAPGVEAHVSRIVHSTTIVVGGLLAGLSYELVCRPFDVAQRRVNISTVERQQDSRWSVLANKAREDGIVSFF